MLLLNLAWDTQPWNGPLLIMRAQEMQAETVKHRLQADSPRPRTPQPHPVPSQFTV